MKLNEVSLVGDALYECDVCKLEGELNSYIIQEEGRDLCLPCWYEGIKARGNRSPLAPASPGA